MREFLIAQRDDGRKLEKWLAANVPGLTMGLMRKYVRLKRIKINGRPAHDGARLAAGDAVELYLNDELFEEKPRENKLLASFKYRVDVAYEDENILIVDKRPGLRAHPDDEEKVDTLVTHIQAYLYQKGEYDESFLPALCNRIDRFTGGLVIAAKNREALLCMDRLIRSREVKKFYLCAVAGKMSSEAGALKGYLLKEGKRVRVIEKSAPGAQCAETLYRVLSYENGASLIECELVTGRTHQIRAQFAAAGHPLIGDTQYGDPAINREYPVHFQQLYAYRVEFAFTSDAGILSYLNGKSVRVKALHKGFSEIEKRR
jgi:23S rRNA pseudouridine955/2504/2580 synthase